MKRFFAKYWLIIRLIWHYKKAIRRIEANASALFVFEDWKDTLHSMQVANGVCMCAMHGWFNVEWKYVPKWIVKYCIPDKFTGDRMVWGEYPYRAQSWGEAVRLLQLRLSNLRKELYTLGLYRPKK